MISCILLRPIFIFLFLVYRCLSVAPASEMPSPSELTVYAGTYTDRDTPSDGIYGFKLKFNDDFSNFTHAALRSTNVVNPSFLTVTNDKRFLLAVSEAGKESEAKVSSYRILADGNLEHVNSQPSLGTFTCYISVSPNNDFAYLANYVGGIAASYAIDARSGRLDFRNKMVVTGHLAYPIHLAVPIGTTIGCSCVSSHQNLGSHHFVVEKISSNQCEEKRSELIKRDLFLETLEYDVVWPSCALFKICKIVDGKIQRKRRRLSDLLANGQSLFRIEHPDEKQLGDRQSVLSRFEKVADETCWNLLSNNCEHLANYLLTADHYSYQIEFTSWPKCVLARSLGNMLRGQLSFGGFCRLLSIFVVHGLNFYALTDMNKRKYEVVWLIVYVVETFVLIVVEGRHFRAVFKRSPFSTEALVEISHAFSFLCLSTSSFSLGTLTGHFHPQCDSCIYNEIALSLISTLFALGFLHPLFCGTIDYFLRNGRRPRLTIVKEVELPGGRKPVEDGLVSHALGRNQCNNACVSVGALPSKPKRDMVLTAKYRKAGIFMYYVIFSFCLTLFLAPLFCFIHFDELERRFVGNYSNTCWSLR